MAKEKIRQFAFQLGADAVGFASIEDYHSEKSPRPQTLLSNPQSIVVLGYRELNGAMESPNARVSMTARMGGMDLSLKNNYLVGRFIEDRYHVKSGLIPFSYPLDMGPESKGFVGDLSLRHAAVAAGLGVLGRHNLVIHPRFGTRIVFAGMVTELPLESDPPVKDELCTRCGLCVKACPALALNEEGKTEVMKCLESSQPYGIGAAIKYWRRFIGASPEEQKAHLKDPVLLSLYQAQFIGFQYTCGKCMAVCPACIES